MRYSTKNVEIEAEQYVKANGIDNILSFVGDSSWIEWFLWDGAHLKIKTLEGLHIVSDGDFVIRGLTGEYYPCKPEVFHKKYTPSSEKYQVGDRVWIMYDNNPWEFKITKVKDCTIHRYDGFPNVGIEHEIEYEGTAITGGQCSFTHKWTISTSSPPMARTKEQLAELIFK